jgi:hypothetical protein
MKAFLQEGEIYLDFNNGSWVIFSVISKRDQLFRGKLLYAHVKSGGIPGLVYSWDYKDFNPQHVSVCPELLVLIKAGEHL